MATIADTLDRTMKRLGALRPTPRSLVLHLADGERKTLAVPERRRKWVGIRKQLETYKWETIEAVNEKGAIIDTLSNDAEDDYGLPVNDEHKPVAESAQMLALMLRAQDVALRRDKERIELLLTHQTKLVELVMGRLTAIEKDNMSHLRRISDMMLEGASDDDEAGISGPMIANLLSMWANQPSTPATPPKPNGSKKAATKQSAPKATPSK
jgi:hypothetical protein